MPGRNAGKILVKRVRFLKKYRIVDEKWEKFKRIA